MKSQKLGFLSSLLFKWQSQATFVGKAMLPVLLLIRLVTLGAAAQTAWLDDEREFICNSHQPGCDVACFNEAMPLSPARLWTIQLLLVLAPGLVFLCYLIHLTNQEIQVRTRNEEVKGHALGVYLACMAFVILVEVGFIVAQSLLYGFWVDTHYMCRASPCLSGTDCTIPHAWEKTIFLVIMLTASCISLLLSVVELVCVLLRAKARHGQPDGAKALQSWSGVEESWSFLSQLLALWHSHAGLLGKTILPVLQLIRLVIIGAAVQPVWHGDLGDFVCNTIHPGCKQAGFNEIFPFSLRNYWTLQVLLVLAPGLIFFCYLIYIIIMKETRSPETWVKGQVLGAYLGLLTAVVLVEVGFTVGQALIFGFSLSTTSVISAKPCFSRVECYTSQATEKTVFMVIMLCVACLSSLLTLVEMCMVLKSERPWEKSLYKMSEASGFEMSPFKEKTTEDNESCTTPNI
ncbi:uncharacterized protein LOC111236698 [Seriola dumerili]|uniref:Uncharacterized LOC111236698 n=1 Tax=Seriola dumerili TaxID=41447 RepID=A0A3B4TJL5_SERDU|nr:uncharacterized protein LOC111236698 [Seriola dumerili]